MKVYVQHISIPAMSTIGYGLGTSDDGDRVAFVGDHRPMYDILDALIGIEAHDEKVVEAEVDELYLIPLAAFPGGEPSP